MKGTWTFVALAAVFLSINAFPRTLASPIDPGHAQLVSKKSKRVARATKLAKVRADLHRNLDGKGNGFITGWSFDSKVLTLVVDKSRYQENMLYAATITARSIFDLNGVSLPMSLVIRDRYGEVLGEGPFANVPKIVE